jgi:hypothetical protein
MAEPTLCCVRAGSYCARVDILFNLPGVHVLEVTWRKRSGRIPAGLGLLVETDPAETGCPGCGVIATGHGRRLRRLHDIPAFGAPVELVWRQRRYRCLEPACQVGGFSEDHLLSGPRAKLTTRAAWWAISCIQRDTASVAALARRLGVDWHTVWDAIAPLLHELAGDPARLTGVDTLGVDEHIVRHEALLVRMEVGDLDRFAVAAARWSWRQPVPGETLGSGGSSRDKVRAVRDCRTDRAW